MTTGTELLELRHSILTLCATIHCWDRTLLSKLLLSKWVISTQIVMDLKLAVSLLELNKENTYDDNLNWLIGLHTCKHFCCPTWTVLCGHDFTEPVALLILKMECNSHKSGKTITFQYLSCRNAPKISQNCNKSLLQHQTFLNVALPKASC